MAPACLDGAGRDWLAGGGWLLGRCGCLAGRCGRGLVAGTCGRGRTAGVDVVGWLAMAVT